MTLNWPQPACWKSNFLPRRKISFSMRYQNVQCFTLDHVCKPKVGFVSFYFLLAWSSFFLPFSFFSPLLLLLDFFWCWLCLEMEHWLTWGVMLPGHFTTNFAQKTSVSKTCIQLHYLLTHNCKSRISIIDTYR